MKIVSVISQKGGSGKTTVSVHLAVAAARRGYTVAVIDLDPQATAATWGDWRGGENPVVVHSVHTRLAPTLAEAKRQDVHFAIIDSPPAADAAAVAAAKAADLVIVPTRPAAFDLHAVKTTAELLKIAQKPGFAVLNAVPARSVGLIEEVRQVVESYGLSLSPATIVDRAAYRHAVVDGRTAVEFEPLGKAASEIDELYMWACGQMDMSPRPRNKPKRNVA